MVQFLIEILQATLSFILNVLHSLHLAVLGLCWWVRSFLSFIHISTPRHAFAWMTNTGSSWMLLLLILGLMSLLILKESRFSGSCRPLLFGRRICLFERHDLLLATDVVCAFLLFQTARFLVSGFLCFYLLEETVNEGWCEGLHLSWLFNTSPSW